MLIQYKRSTDHPLRERRPVYIKFYQNEKWTQTFRHDGTAQTEQQSPVEQVTAILQINELHNILIYRNEGKRYKGQ